VQDYALLLTALQTGDRRYRARVSPVSVNFGVLQPRPPLKIGICSDYQISGEGRPTSDFDWLDRASREAVCVFQLEKKSTQAARF
jgi:hypothetical protein